MSSLFPAGGLTPNADGQHAMLTYTLSAVLAVATVADWWLSYKVFSRMGKFVDDERIPSVREYAVLLEVNTNTAVKSYDLLEQQGVIYKKRGLGYFVTAGAKQRILDERKKEFMEVRLPELFRQMRLLGIGIDEVDGAWKKAEK